MSALTEAFKELCAVCRPRPDQDESVLMSAASRLWKVLGEYPEPIALTALDTWPRRSEWFPTEKELRGLLDEIAAEAAREAAARGHADDGRYKQPVGNTVLFVEEVRKLRGPDYVKSWLAGGITCMFTANHVYTTNIGADRLSKDVGALAEQMGVKIIFDRACSEMLARYCDERGLVFGGKGRGR